MQQTYAQQIAAHRARLQQLRDQRPYRALGSRNVVSLAAHRIAKFPLVGSSK